MLSKTLVTLFVATLRGSAAMADAQTIGGTAALILTYPSPA